MRAAVHRVDAIGEGEERLAVAVVVLDRHLDVGLLDLLLDMHWLRHHDVAVLVQVPHEGLEAAVEVERHLLLAALALIHQRERQPAIEVRHLADALRECLELEVASLHDREVRLEDRRRARADRWTHRLHRRDRHTAAILLHIQLIVAPHLDTRILGERVHRRDADAMQAAGPLLVAVATELAAGVQRRHHDLKRGL